MRTLRRPPGGWDRKPNYLLPDAIGLVLLLFGGACFFNWMAAAIEVVLTAM